MIKIPGSKKFVVDTVERSGNWHIEIRSVRGEVEVKESMIWPHDEKPNPNVTQSFGETWLAGRREGERVGERKKEKQIHAALGI